MAGMMMHTDSPSGWTAQTNALQAAGNSAQQVLMHGWSSTHPHAAAHGGSRIACVQVMQKSSGTTHCIAPAPAHPCAQLCLTIRSSEGVHAGGRGAARVMSRHTQLLQSHSPTQPSASRDSR